MQTLGSALDEQKGFAQGFDFLRIFLATSIIGWHAAKLSGHVEMARTSVFWFSECLLVPMFFALSGFLVAGSSMRLSTKDFVLNRAARILPALFADIVFAALLIGPLVTTLSAKQYFADATFFTYFLNITGWMQYFWGVFENNPLPEVNGALWDGPLRNRLLRHARRTDGLRSDQAPEIGTIVHLRRFDGRDLSFATSHLVSDHVSLLENLAMNLFLFKGSLLLPSFRSESSFISCLPHHIPFSRSFAIGLVCVAMLVSAAGDFKPPVEPRRHIFRFSDI